MWGKVDLLRGLKENVIMGRLIPAGTGMARYQNIGIRIDAPEELLQGPEEEPPTESPAPLDESIPAGEVLMASGEVPADPIKG
jgi:hypothetical protein